MGDLTCPDGESEPDSLGFGWFTGRFHGLKNPSVTDIGDSYLRSVGYGFKKHMI